MDNIFEYNPIASAQTDELLTELAKRPKNMETIQLMWGQIADCVIDGLLAFDYGGGTIILTRGTQAQMLGLSGFINARVSQAILSND